MHVHRLDICIVLNMSVKYCLQARVLAILFSLSYHGVAIPTTRVQSEILQNHTQPLIRFNSNGTLKIVQFTDMHYGESPFSVGPEDDRNTTTVIGNILDWERPDFVVFTGDLVTGDSMIKNVSSYINMMLGPLVEKGYRWSTAYGNHDTGPLVSRLDILRIEQSYGELCYTKQATSADLPGVSNYYLPIYAATSENRTEGQEEHPVMLWWFLDSQGGYTLNERQPFYIDQKVVYWFGNESQRLQDQWGLLPSLVFFHIPPVEYVDVQKGILNNPLCSKQVDESVTPQEKDTGIMKALLNAGGVKTLFVGHDHGNSWCCFYKEIEICYNRHTGYGGYGNWTRGARVIKLNINNLGNRTNYVRLENGEIAEKFPNTHSKEHASHAEGIKPHFVPFFVCGLLLLVLNRILVNINWPTTINYG